MPKKKTKRPAKKKSKAVFEYEEVPKPPPAPPPKKQRWTPPAKEPLVEEVKTLTMFPKPQKPWPGWLQIENQRPKIKPVVFPDDPHKIRWPPEDGAVILAALSYLGTRLTNKKKAEDFDEFSLAAKLEALGQAPGRRELCPEMVENVVRKVLHIYTRGTKRPETVSQAVYNLIFWPEFNGGFM